MAFTITAPGYARTRVFAAPSISIVGRSGFESMLENDIDSVFFNQSEFGTTISYYHVPLGVWESYKDIFDNPHTSMQFGAEADFNSLKPQVQLQESKLKHPVSKNDSVRVKGIVYKIEDYVSDGVGITTVFLQRPQ